MKHPQRPAPVSPFQRAGFQRAGFRRSLPIAAALVAVVTANALMPGNTVNADPAPTTPTALATPQEMARQVDRGIADQLKAEDITPAPAADDATFLRRIYLDVIGTVPTPAEVNAFLKDRSKDKRTRTVDELLAHEGYADYWSMWWYRTLTGLSVNARGRAGGARNLSGIPARKFHGWIETQLENNRPYNEMVFDLLTASGRTDENGAAGYIARWEGEANNTIGAVSRHFMGLQIQCAQCHDHMYEESWKQSDFKGMAAFFATTRPSRVPEYQQIQALRRKQQADKAKQRDAQRGGMMDDDAMGGGSMGGDEMDGGAMDGPTADTPAPSRRELRKKFLELAKYRNVVDVQDFKVSPRALDRMGKRAKQRPEILRRMELLRVTPKLWHGAEMPELPGVSRRYLLGRWITADDNPYFAQALVNRLWGTLMGTGFVNPIDDFNSFNEPSHPELLKMLSKDFIASGYDLKRTIRIMLNTKAYQRSAVISEGRQDDPQTFAVGKVRPLTTDQLSFAVIRAVGLDGTSFSQARRAGRSIREAIARSFTFVFDDDEGAESEDFEGSIPQGLFMMNGQVMSRVLGSQRRMPVDQMLRRIDDNNDRIEHLYLAAYGRSPTKAEHKMAKQFIKGERAGEAFSDLLWALVNSAEFMTNH